MNQALYCKNCGYDLHGHEFISNTVDSSLFNGTAQYSDKAILNLSQKSSNEISCPFCQSKGSWTH
ncbi:MAG: hypothetical protein ATN36_04025 [Epulopiscium sp. Nele67-Bin005]|nr:MAG: hypothetical protein ATN36_04025 [Epulopiscium sp. Nele67-Bin005]